MAIEHIVTDYDTVQGLALQYGVAWTDIVDFNNLEYPYIVADQDTAYATLYAQGYLTVTRQNTQSDLTIYAGSAFMTHGDVSGFQKVYLSVDDLTIPAGQSTGYLFVRSQIIGTYGNVIANSIQVVGALLTNQGAITDLTVLNETSLTNGKDANVLITGQTILIPVDVSDVAVINNKGAFLDYLGGEDLELTSEGLLDIDGFGDVSSVIGLENIKQAVRDRLQVELSSLTQHPEYGAGIFDLIGKFGAPTILKRIDLEIHQALSYEDRVQATTVNSVDIEGTSVYIDITLTIANKTTNLQLVLES